LEAGEKRFQELKAKFKLPDPPAPEGPMGPNGPTKATDAAPEDGEAASAQ
jgi:hypothetical protein